MLKEKELKKAREEGRDLLQMYQAGFLDGYNEKCYRKRRFKKISGRCQTAFELRFADRLQGKIKLKRKKQ